MSNNVTSLFELNGQENYLVLYREYSKIVKNAISATIIGIYHQDYLGKRKLSSFTIDEIYHSLGGCVKQILIKTKLDSLCSNGWIKKSRLSPIEAKNLVCQKQPQSFSLGTLTCQWCQAQTLILDNHHYPILKSKGGQEIVKICPNCHQEFHQLLRITSYHPSENLISFLRSLQHE